MAPSALTVGVISDTHGLLRPAALHALRGADAIIHAGDIGHPGILETLAALAPLTVVKGNIDTQPWCAALPDTAEFVHADVRLLVVHDLSTLALDPVAAGYAAVVSGHSHKPGLSHRGTVLLLNPGSAGPRRFRLPISIARLRIDAGGVSAELIALDP
ncbi:metallophosphatase family protein [Acetobacteraceae bacterium KSS8]|uniref:Phosphoesterase n=1 Tax=Endosaccharibacter trunci TaxID=2812733 RepID=A0ABT1W6J0_9PROT|nr:metallophosphatase family protein [Acetobacteraceae bacterium KSS8]